MPKAKTSPVLFFVLLPGLLAGIYYPALQAGLMFDDHYFKVFAQEDFPKQELPPGTVFGGYFMSDGSADQYHFLINNGIVPWWSHPDIDISFWRPLAELAMWVDFNGMGGHYWLMHLHSLLWFFFMICTFYIFLRELSRNKALALAAVAFLALNDSVLTPVVWISNRYSLMAAAFALLSAWAFVRGSRNGQIRYWAVLSPLFLSLALLSGESGLQALFFIGAFVLFACESPWPKRFTRLIPVALVSLAWLVLHKILGHGAYHSGEYLNPLSQPAYFLAELPGRFYHLARLMFFGPLSSPVPDSSLPYALPDSLILLAIGSFIIRLSIFNKYGRIFLFTLALSLLMACISFPMKRHLLFPDLSFSALMGIIFAKIRNHEPQLWFRRNVIGASLFAGLFIIIHPLFSLYYIPRAIAMQKHYQQEFLIRHIKSFPDDQAFANKKVIVLNTENNFFFFMGVRLAYGMSIPDKLWVLSPDAMPVQYARTGKRSLLAKPEGGFMKHYYDYITRSKHELFTAGDSIVLEGMTVCIEKTDRDGRPLEAHFFFDHPLEWEGYLIYYWAPEKQAFSIIQAPAIGSTLMINE